MSVETDNVDTLLNAIMLKYGYDFTNYARASMIRRIAYSMKEQGIEDFDDFSSLLLNEEPKFELFIRHLTINVTEMFRDPHYYKIVRQQVLNRLSTYPVVRIWIAGCSTGEEVYSWSILLHEAGLLDRSVIYATDLNSEVLDKAKNGVYNINQMKEYTKNYIKSGGCEEFSNYYTAKYDAAVIRNFLKQNVVFALHNLITDTSFNEFQLISCRNVMIYFNQLLQNQVIKLFHQSLCTFGMLCLGDKESLIFSEQEKSFKAIDARNRIFMKIH